MYLVLLLLAPPGCLLPGAPTRKIIVVISPVRFRPAQDFLEQRGFWDGAADYDFWYALTGGECFWLHVRRHRGRTLAAALFCADGEAEAELDLYDLTRAGVHGLRATIVNGPLFTLQRLEPEHPLVALRLRDGRSHAFTLAAAPEALAEQWFHDALERLHAALTEQFHLLHVPHALSRGEMAALWPGWAGPVQDYPQRAQKGVVTLPS